MKKKVFLIFMVMSGILFCNCTNKDTSKQLESGNLPLSSSTQVNGKVSGTPCDLTVGNIRFTKSINDAASSIKVQKDGKVVFTAKEKTDYFSDPNGKLSNTSAPILLTDVDNTKPFTFTAKVTPGFNEQDVYNAGVLYVYANDSFFQKHCFEQDERGKHRIVTVQTVGTSDDSNHDIVELPYAYMKISSDTRTIASYYSLDNINWQMVRLYENNYPDEIWLGISSQCPMGEGNESVFEDIHLEEKSVSDFRMGI
ncbi:regulation of enolase protein 1 (concanavalin A-like superfamily) [Parabacteroides sp. PF5-5]|uniref:DUF1349 domain-containing protein n=1 Tax=Bacteroidales TaxID=171549 RepID=UPI001EF256D5|nr:MULTISPECIES: DUF1349 domain-containing protein [Bacteroidales]MDH6306713.1 regulation of enolase protein 1 (concanavalin A-like superfamily) [Parabacteroides sp. PH5-39]MDH6316204.1 regulation of enolase protein 1 (concanavalin A-like superfamily) [Parabacteroides sp. PF5-13]MDH6321435.1 regulation of enolase protein 1 (concanavalin A-like superfamily) [Parabacteroides sp. PH5-13]MDH6325166.1 regulation of enolase protein 1 (concanavalin A-like superfamily) [Parabacteroides sp. PH5-8]MDH63